MKDSGILIHDNADKVPPAAPGKHPLTPVSGADFHRPGLRLPAQAWLILTVACLLPLLLALWGLYGVIERMTLLYPWLMDVLGFALFAAFLGVIVGTPIAAAFRIWIGTMHARVVRTAHGAMADVVTVMGVTQQAAEGQQAALIETMAVHNQFATPNLSTLSAPGGKTEKVETLALPDAGPDVNAIPSAVWLSWFDRVPHVMLAAETGGGKTTTALHILAPRLRAGEACYIIDPNASGWGGIPSVGGGEDWDAVSGAMGAVIRLYGERQQARAEALQTSGRELPHDHFPRLTVILDEAYMAKQALDTGKDSIWRRFVPILGSGARKVGISVILLTQTANVEDIGLSAPLRENYTRLALDSGAARKFIQMEEPDRKRKEALLAALSGVSFPAVAERNGQIVILDRSDLDKAPSLPRDVQAWQPVMMAQKPNPHQALIHALRAAKEKGLTREQTRAMGLRFDNDLWSEV